MNRLVDNRVPSTTRVWSHMISRRYTLKREATEGRGLLLFCLQLVALLLYRSQTKGEHISMFLPNRFRNNRINKKGQKQVLLEYNILVSSLFRRSLIIRLL
jgi:hypothetical protein